jgi:chemotaxis protein CheX
MIISKADVQSIIEYVWDATFGVVPERDERGAFPGHRVTACVQFTGSWEGAVTLACSERMARRATACMFGIDPDAASFQQVRDALGELANIVGGNIKALLPSPTLLSLPMVADGDERALHLPYTAPVCSVAFVSREDPFVVSLVRGTGAPDGSRVLRSGATIAPPRPHQG